MKGEIWKGQWKRGSGSCWESESCVTGKLSEFIIIDQGTGFLHRLQYGAEPTIPQNEKEVGASLRSAGSERC